MGSRHPCRSQLGLAALVVLLIVVVATTGRHRIGARLAPRAISTAHAPGEVPMRERVALLVHRQLDRRLSPFGVWLMRRTKGSVTARFDVHALVLTTTGRRSGRPRSVVLQYFEDGDAMIVVATNDGGATHPAWYRNLEASGTARIEVDGRAMDVRALKLTGKEAADWWQRILERAPDYQRYARVTNRAFPILRLVPASSPS